jgi:hypothetical protein
MLRIVKKPSFAVVAACIAITSCGYLAERTAPEKQASTVRTAAAYLTNPADAVSASHIGWLHIWRLAERQRLTTIPATITDDAILARRYFQEAVALNPADARYLGFLAAAVLAEGQIHQDEKLTRRGYFMLLDA